MSEQAVHSAAGAAAFAPTGKPWIMRARHVPFDEVVAAGHYEQQVIERLLRGEAVLILGPSGTGKTSLAAWVSSELPHEVVSVRLLVSGLQDPTDVGEVMKLALGTMLEVIEVDSHEREEIQSARADSRTTSRAPAGITGGKFGGGHIPVEVNVEVGSLRQDFKAEKLNGECVWALNRILAILAENQLRVVFVMDDAEAIVGGPDQAVVVEGLLGGAARIFVEELDAAFLLAIQPHLVEASNAYERLAAGTLVVELPLLGERAPEGLRSILKRCLEVAQITHEVSDVFTDDALTGLVQFYDDTRGDIRKTLSAASYATEDAASMNALKVTAAHIRVGASQAL